MQFDTDPFIDNKTQMSPLSIFYCTVTAAGEDLFLLLYCFYDPKGNKPLMLIKENNTVKSSVNAKVLLTQKF